MSNMLIIPSMAPQAMYLPSGLLKHQIEIIHEFYSIPRFRLFWTDKIPWLFQYFSHIPSLFFLFLTENFIHFSK